MRKVLHSQLIAVVKSASEAIGTVPLADDLGIKLRVRLHVDAAAALGILERQGVGRVRHLYDYMSMHQPRSAYSSDRAADEYDT